MKYRWSTYTVVDTPSTLSTKKVIRIDVGTWPSPPRRGSTTPEATVAATKATNHGVARWTPSKSNAPSGAVTAQSSTALDAWKPPRLACNSTGNASIMRSWLVQNGPNRLVRANTMRPAMVASW
jgi:hypothetical protein